MKSLFPRWAAAMALVCCAAAQAHVSLEWPAAFAGTSYKASFRITHGCGASPTREVSVEIPKGVAGAKPMPKPGWALRIERAALPAPQQRHGRTVTEDVVRITWTAQGKEHMLDAAHFDEFVLLATLPQEAGRLAWPVRQLCVDGRHDWVQVPRDGAAGAKLDAPAPSLDVMPASPSGHHAH